MDRRSHWDDDLIDAVRDAVDIVHPDDPTPPELVAAGRSPVIPAATSTHTPTREDLT